MKKVEYPDIFEPADLARSTGTVISITTASGQLEVRSARRLVLPDTALGRRRISSQNSARSYERRVWERCEGCGQNAPKGGQNVEIGGQKNLFIEFQSKRRNDLVTINFISKKMVVSLILYKKTNNSHSNK